MNRFRLKLVQSAASKPELLNHVLDNIVSDARHDAKIDLIVAMQQAMLDQSISSEKRHAIHDFVASFIGVKYGFSFDDMSPGHVREYLEENGIPS